MQYETSRIKFGGKISFLALVEKKRVKEETKMQKSEDWSMGNF